MVPAGNWAVSWKSSVPGSGQIAVYRRLSSAAGEEMFGAPEEGFEAGLAVVVAGVGVTLTTCGE
ncbi:hypothetical protein ACFVYR_17815 [Streptomyces sp. NPDC058284]|uniref:hypothetical protein n=1 Tax=unclassified Streptomyces TaxID=2593676 RepID=UPI00364F9A03